MNEAERTVADRMYSDQDWRQRVEAEMRKRPDVALNGIMHVVADAYICGIRDGDAFGKAGPAYLEGVSP